MPRVRHPDKPATIRTDENVSLFVKLCLFVVIEFLSGAGDGKEYEQNAQTWNSVVPHVTIIRLLGIAGWRKIPIALKILRCGVKTCNRLLATVDSSGCGRSLDPNRLQGSDSLTLFSLEGIEIVVFAFILVLLVDRYTNGSEQLPVLLGTSRKSSLVRFCHLQPAAAASNFVSASSSSLSDRPCSFASLIFGAWLTSFHSSEIVVKSVAAVSGEVNIGQAIVVIVADGDAHSPAFAREPCGLGDVGELETGILMVEGDSGISALAIVLDGRAIGDNDIELGCGFPTFS